MPPISPTTQILALALVLGSLGGCAKDNQFDETGGIKITRSACPAVAIPAYTGDMTLFDPPASREARAIDVVATMTNLRHTCAEADQLVTTVTFDVQARRTNAAGPRDIVVPYFATVLRGGTNIVSKQVGRVAIHFDAGQERATGQGTATGTVSRAAATLPANVLQQITRKRKPGDADASIDPMADPATRAAVSAASFELLVGFQLTNDQLAYNATR